MTLMETLQSGSDIFPTLADQEKNMDGFQRSICK